MENRKDNVWAIFLIFLGTIFLLNTTGILAWNVWLYIFRFWPIFLILGGFKLILGNSIVSTILVSIIAFLAFVFAGSCAYINNTGKNISIFKNLTPICSNFTVERGDEVNENFTVETSSFENIKNLVYEFNLGVSEFTITDSTDKYLDINSKFSTAYGKPKITSNSTDETLNITMKESDSEMYLTNWITPEYDISIGSSIQSILKINNGIGNGVIDLNKQNIKEIDINTGTGNIEITLTLDSVPQDLRLGIGTGNIILNIPSNVGFNMSYDLGLGNILIDGEDIANFSDSKKDFQSQNIQSAQKTFNIDSNVGIGNLEINFLNN